MSIRAVIQGMLLGYGFVGVFAAIVALVDYHAGITAGAAHILVWLGAGLSALSAGVAAGRLADIFGWLHGLFAGIALNLTGSVIAETLRLAVGGQVWASLGLAALAGLVGGMWGANTRY